MAKRMTDEELECRIAYLTTQREIDGETYISYESKDLSGIVRCFTLKLEVFNKLNKNQKKLFMS